MSKEINSIQELIEYTGGPLELAYLTKRNQWTVTRWFKTGVPVEVWEKIQEKYPEITTDTLYSISLEAKRAYKKSLEKDY